MKFIPLLIARCYVYVLDLIFKRRLFRPLKKIGGVIASYWPWPVRADVQGRPIYVDLRSAVGRGIFATGRFDDGIFEALIPFLSEGSVFFDVGANVGYYTFLASSYVGSHGQVHAFEIDPRSIFCLKKTIRLNCLGFVAIHEVALGERKGVGYLNAKKDCGHSSAGENLKGVPVPMATLDMFLGQIGDSQVSAVKIDVEGAELAVLKGSAKVLQDHRPVIVCEVVENHLQVHGHSANQLLSFLSEHGYWYRWLDGVHTPAIIAVPNE